MAGLISAAEAAGIRTALALFLVHLRDSAPANARGRRVDSADTHAVSIRQVDQSDAAQSCGADLLNGSGGEFGIRAGFPLWGPSAPLSVSIRRVFGTCPKEQVVWVATRRIVALVANVETVSDRAECQNPGNAVSQLFISVLESAVPVFGSEPLPRPAFIWPCSQYFAPESITDGLVWFRPAVDVAGRGAELPAALPNVRLKGSECCAACLACPIYGHGSLVAHRDLPLIRNRGAGPGLLVTGAGSFRCNFTTSDQIGRAA